MKSVQTNQKIKINANRPLLNTKAITKRRPIIKKNCFTMKSLAAPNDPNNPKSDLNACVRHQPKKG